MSKKVIVLADNSYTIRRIVELSFSEIENIEVRSFESGAGIKEKLLQLNPSVVIVDIKLPEFNGYDVCRYMNETPPLSRSRVFLMKGSFEPVDNEMIKNLKYEDIITKPFDSNALVNSVMKALSQEKPEAAADLEGEGPSSFPEEFPEIEPESAETEDISFSDIRSAMQSPPVPGRPGAGTQSVERDEIQPSEEITQGAQMPKDNLMPQEAEEPFKNPFEEEPSFEEISVASASTPRPTSLEYEQEPPREPRGAAEPRDASDEFHERFIEMASEDTSEDIVESPLDVAPAGGKEEPTVAEGQKQGPPPATEEKLSLEFETTDMGSPAQTMVAGPAVMAPGKMPPKGKGLGSLEEMGLDKERTGEKHRSETLSPQEELARLAGAPKKEAKAEPAPVPEERFAMNGRLEEKLGLTIKELLWEIVPPLAEKIIKEEIDKIKSEMNDGGL
ncbi:MAG: response regulator [Candidatus Aminicenantes bacterium]|nr:response regulator [Candidatus Aminicenantes bacterium]